HRAHAALALRRVLRHRRDPLGDAPRLGRRRPRRPLGRHQAVLRGPRLPRGRRDPRRGRAVRLAPRPRALMDQLLAFDERLYLAILAARTQLIGVIAVIVTLANFQGLVWWILGGALMRNRGAGRRGA